MATAISVANFQAACGEVYDALTTSSFASAYLWLARAEAQLAGLPTVGVSEGTTVQLRQSLASLAEAVKNAEARSTTSIYEKHSRWVV